MSAAPLLHVLGGGPWQLPTVLLAKSMGLRVLVTDKYRERPAFAVADFHAVIDITSFSDTFSRRKGLATTHALDVIDYLAAACPQTTMVLLHGTGVTMLEMYEIVRAADNLILDLSFTIVCHRGSSLLDADMNYLFRTTDQLITIGSDFPEYAPALVTQRFAELAEEAEPHRVENITHRNLERLFAGYQVPVPG